MRYLVILLVFFLAGCGVYIRGGEDLIQESELLDEEKLVQTLAKAWDDREERIFGKIDRTVSKSLDRTDILIEKALQRTENLVNNNIQTTLKAIDQKHQEFLGRLPWYFAAVALIIWIASVIDDVFRWWVGKPKKWRK